MSTDAEIGLFAFAAEHDGVFTLEHARQFGVTDRQIDRRLHQAWHHLHVGVYRIAGAPPTWKGQLRAACWSTEGLVAVSHRSAAALYELPGGRTDVAEITCARWLRAREPGVVVHESRRLAANDIGSLDGIPVVTPERLLFDLASWRPNANYLEMVVHAARRKRLITYESAQSTFERHARRGLRGVSALRSALQSWDPAQRATESEMETLLVQRMRRNNMPEPTLQHEIHDKAGQFVARTDMAFPLWRIAIEYDSKQEHSDEFQLARDARRRNRIVTCGYILLIARSDDVKRGGSEICDVLDAAIQNRRQETTGAVVS
jgi:very-short-patch-repair endonuclease